MELWLQKNTSIEVMNLYMYLARHRHTINSYNDKAKSKTIGGSSVAVTIYG